MFRRLSRLSPRRALDTLDQVGNLRDQVQRLQLRVDQLITAYESTEKTALRLRRALQAFDAERGYHVADAVAAEALCLDPFPHLVVERLQPDTPMTS